MFISDGAKALLSAPMDDDAGETSGESTSFSDNKGDSCATRVFRAESPEEDQKLADRWEGLLHDKCNGLGSEITVRRMAMPQLGMAGYEANIVVAANACDLVLKDEPEHEEAPRGRTGKTRRGVWVTEDPEDPARVNIQYESGLVDLREGSIRYNSIQWTVAGTLRSRVPGVRAGEFMHDHDFRDLHEAILGVEKSILDQEKTLGEHLERVQRTNQEAQAEIGQIFCNL